MEFGAVLAYKRIDATVEATLQAAAEALKNLELSIDKGAESAINPNMEHKSVTVTSCSVSSVSSADHQPQPTIRAPVDVNRKVFFPKATIGSKSSVPSCGTTSTSYDTVTTPPPDSLFPSAVYIPARKDSKIQISCTSQIQTSSSELSEPRSVYRKHVEKLATEPLVDLRDLKCRGLKKPKPDSLFPKATYKAGKKPKVAISPCTSRDTSTASSAEFATSAVSGDAPSFAYQPMEFVSVDGRVRMLLQPLEAKEEAKKVSVMAPKVIEDFPVVPKQLESDHKLKIGRTKFSTKLNIHGNYIDLSGIFTGNSLKRQELAKLVINGQSFSL